MDTPFADSTTFYQTNSRQSLAPLSSLEPYQLHQSGLAVPHTLPPLQPQHVAALSPAHDLFGQSRQSPRSSQPSNVPSSTTLMGSYAHYAPQASTRYNGSQPSYIQPVQSYHTSQTYIPQFSNAPSYQHNVAAVPPQSRLPDLRPMPAGGLHQPSMMSSSYAQAQHLPPPSSIAEQEVQPTHVVGSQGRRGILPSAAGRPPAVAGEGTASAKSAVIPTKDADGKFPCPHCIKTYLHAKHLKRHLLRHTGDRPYMCILCKDTFSRSDILKRHFQKCSLRRGNPTGASHLSHSLAHVKKSQAGANKDSTPQAGGPDLLGESQASENFGMPTLSNVYGDHNARLPLQSNYPESDQSLSDPASRANSIKRPSSAGGRNRRSLTGPGPAGFNRNSFTYKQEELSPGPHSNNADSTPLTLSTDRKPNQHPGHGPNQSQFGFDSHADGTMRDATASQPYTRGSSSQMQSSSQSHGNDFDWPAIFQPGAQDAYINMFSSNMADQQQAVKPEQGLMSHPFANPNDNPQEGMLNGIYGTTSSSATGGGYEASPAWNLDLQDTDPLQNKTNLVIAFCFPRNSDFSPAEQAEARTLKQYLTAENLNHFAELFLNFQGHWPLLHMPTFDFLRAYDGLVLAMVCIGAVYSDRMSVPQVQALMRRAKIAVERNTHIFGDDGGERYSTTSGNINVEELQALVLLQISSTWHGDPAQRKAARQEFAKFATFARRSGLIRPTEPGSPVYSSYHQATLPDHMSVSNWDWRAWLEQEKRSRLMFSLFLLDAALVIYFNCQPQLDAFEIRLPLPADDAAWEGPTAVDCADALGLNGSAAQSKNITGSRRLKQPEMHKALKALLHATYDFQRRTTNVYSKFILIHALHVQIWNVQRQLLQGNVVSGLHDIGCPSSGTSTPISQNDWITTDGSSGHTSNSNSGQATPTDSCGPQSPGTHQILKATTSALSKWKKTWDEDMAIQYPPIPSAIKRFGFCRDGVHFFWLARAFLRNNRGADWQAAPDSRFSQVISWLKQVRKWVASDNAQRGEEIGSVGDIDESYGVENLTLDMKLLFKPFNQQFDSPLSDLQTNNNSNNSGIM